MFLRNVFNAHGPASGERERGRVSQPPAPMIVAGDKCHVVSRRGGYIPLHPRPEPS